MCSCVDNMCRCVHCTWYRSEVDHGYLQPFPTLHLVVMCVHAYSLARVWVHTQRSEDNLHFPFYLEVIHHCIYLVS